MNTPPRSRSADAKDPRVRNHETSPLSPKRETDASPDGGRERGRAKQRPTAKKSMAKPKPVEPEAKAEESDNLPDWQPNPSHQDHHDHASDADSEEGFVTCHACQVLGLRGDERCYDCLLANDLSRLGMGQFGELQSEHWKRAQYQEDLIICEEDQYWAHLCADTRTAAVTGSFSFVRDPDNRVIDITDVQSLRQIETDFYVGDAWHVDASHEDVYEDIKTRSEPEQDRAWQACRRKFSTLRAVQDPSTRSTPRRKPAARREASLQEKRQYAKQFGEAKLQEYKSWKEENDIFELVDMRKEKVENFITGRWVLTVKRDKDGKFLKCKARWVLRGFQDKQVFQLQTDSPTATRPGFRLQCQVAADNNWDLTHIDLKTAFLQGDAFDDNRNVVCQLPPESGLPPYMAARLKRAAYGLNDAPRLWWNRLDKALRGYGLVPARADRCCYILHSEASKASEAAKPALKKKKAHWAQPEAEYEEASLFGRARDSLCFSASKSEKPEDIVRNLSDADLDRVLDYLTDPITGSISKNKKVEGIVTIHVDDALMTGTPTFVKKVVEGLRRDFKVGSEDTNDVLFVGQRVRWLDRSDPKKRHIQVDQERKVEELGEMTVSSSVREDIALDRDQHRAYRSVLGQINWLQSRTQYQACYNFSRCASAAASPTIGDAKALNKLVRKIRAERIVLRFWPLQGNPRIIGFPDAAFRNNPDKSTQRGQVIFLAEPRQKNRIDGRGSLVDYESQKIKTITQSTTVAELNALIKCYGTCQFLRGIWMDMTGKVAEIHIRTDANNLVTTAQTTHLPEQKETIHMIRMLRVEACSGGMEDLAHVQSIDCMADCLTKHSAKPDYLIKAVNTGVLPNVDKHQPFREMMKDKHKAYLLADWIVHNIPNSSNVHSFLGIEVYGQIQQCLALVDWYMLP